MNTNMSISQDKHKPRQNNKTPAPNSIHPSVFQITGEATESEVFNPQAKAAGEELKPAETPAPAAAAHLLSPRSRPAGHCALKKINKWNKICLLAPSQYLPPLQLYDTAVGMD